MKRLLLAAVLLGAACAPLPAQDAPPVRIVMERTACFGMCPVYSVELRGDGTVTYTGKESVRVSGSYAWKIDPAAVRTLAHDMEKAGFFEWQDQYTAPITDLPTTWTTLTIGGRSKKIRNYFGAPQALREMEARIDAISGARGYVSLDAAAVRDMLARGSTPAGADAASWMDHALSAGDAATVSALLAAGMNARAADADGVTLVMKAAMSGDPGTVRAVLAAGGDATARDHDGRNAADRVRDAMAAPPSPFDTFVAATGRPHDFAAILRLLTDE